MATEHSRQEPPSPYWTGASPKWPKPSKNITKPGSWARDHRSSVFVAAAVCGGRFAHALYVEPSRFVSRRIYAVDFPLFPRSIQSSRRSAHPAHLSRMRWRSDAGDAETLVDPNPSSHWRTYRPLLVVGSLPMLALCGNPRSIALSPLSNQS